MFKKDSEKGTSKSGSKSSSGTAVAEAKKPEGESKQATSGTEDKRVFNLHQIYTKNVSFEVSEPAYKLRTKWSPKVEVQIQTKTDDMEDDRYEAILHLTLTANIDDKQAFLLNLDQAVLFTLKHFDQEQRDQALNGLCMNMLHPYACATINQILTQSGLPQIHLAPMNFAAIYQQYQTQKETEGKTTEKETGEGKTKH